MGTINCSDFFDQLGDWMEGQRSPDAAAHVRECPQCRGLIGEMEAIQRTAATLAVDDPEPSPRVWNALRVQLEQEGLIHAPQRGWLHGLGDWVRETFAVVPRPALAGAYLVALIALGIMATGPVSRHLNDAQWISGTETSTQPLSAQLDTAEKDTVSSLQEANPAVTASLHENLAIVDNDIALCEKSVREDPENEIARDYLYDAYQQKADLLAQMTERGDDGP